MATQGSPAKYTYAIAERVDASPWGPLHASLGFDAGEDAVTVFGGEAPHNVNDHVSQKAANLLTVVADTAATLGSNVGWYFAQSQLLIVLGPEHAATIAEDGFTRADVQRYVYEHARLPLHRMKQGAMWGIHDWPRWMDDGGRPRAPARRSGAGRRVRHGRRGIGQALGRRPELLLLARGDPEDHRLATVGPRPSPAAPAPLAARRRAAPGRRRSRSSPAARPRAPRSGSPFGCAC